MLLFYKMLFFILCISFFLTANVQDFIRFISHQSILCDMQAQLRDFFVNAQDKDLELFYAYFNEKNFPDCLNKEQFGTGNIGLIKVLIATCMHKAKRENNLIGEFEDILHELQISNVQAFDLIMMLLNLLKNVSQKNSSNSSSPSQSRVSDEYNIKE